VPTSQVGARLRELALGHERDGASHQGGHLAEVERVDGVEDHQRHPAGIGSHADHLGERGRIDSLGVRRREGRVRERVLVDLVRDLVGLQPAAEALIDRRWDHGCHGCNLVRVPRRDRVPVRDRLPVPIRPSW
jgi:hypothetical protein